jgi:invasion protein IalB
MLTRFEALPVNTRALILAKLAAEMKSAKAQSIYHLAKMQRSDVHGVWRIICRKAAQPVCTIPIGVL